MKRWEIIKEINGYWIVESGKILPPWAHETGEAVGPYDTVEKAKEDFLLRVRKLGFSPVEPLQPPDSMHLTAAQGWLELGNHEEAFEELEQIDAPLRGHPDVLEANLVLLVALGQYGDGVTVSDTHHLARKLKGGGREGEEER